MRSRTIATVIVLPIVLSVLLTWGIVRSDATMIASGAAGLAATIGLGWFSLRRGRHVPLERARALAADDGAAIVLWKPGCGYCEVLLHRLRRRDDIAWVNVWADDEANALVRSVNGGDELTPTVLVGEMVLRNPSAAELAAVLDGRSGVLRPAG